MAAQGHLALIVFLVLGYPDVATSLEALQVLRGLDVAVFELALPCTRGWSPRASAPIVAAHRRAWAEGLRPRAAADLAAPFRPSLYILYRGTWQDLGAEALDLLRDSSDGVLPEWRGRTAERCAELARVRGLAVVEAVSPALAPEELRRRVELTQGMVYLTTAEATGGRLFPAGTVAATLAAIKRCRDIPVSCGFGIRTPEDVLRLGSLEGCDGVIVGTAALEALGEGLGRFERLVTSLARAASGLKPRLAPAG